MAKGTIKETRPGVWRVRVEAGMDPVTTKRIQLSKVVHGGIRAVQAELGKLQREAHAGRKGRQSASVGELLEQWIHNISPNLSPKTVANYRMRIDRELKPTLGQIPVESLTAKHLDKLYGNLGRAGASVYVVRQVHATIRAALTQAVKWGAVERNVAAMATIPSVPPTPVLAPSAEDVSRIVSLATTKYGRPMGAFFALAAVTGARRGELLGLKFSDIDFVGRVLTIERGVVSTSASGIVVKGTKTGRSRRIAIDELATAFLEAQIAQVRSVADAGFDLVADPFLFPGDPTGAETWHPDWPSHAFRKVADELGLAAHLHQLRHFSATQLIAAGTDIRTVSGRLGHADASVTLRVYSHVLETKDREAAEYMGRLLGS